MKIFYKLNNDYNPNDIILNNDKSFGAPFVYFDYQVALTSDRSFILNFDKWSKKCWACEGYLPINKKTKTENIDINKFSNGELLIELDDFEKEVPMKEYLLEYKFKYDANKSRVSIGDINSDEIIMFGKGQYASFKDGKLVGVIIDFK